MPDITLEATCLGRKQGADVARHEKERVRSETSHERVDAGAVEVIEVCMGDEDDVDGR